MRVLVLLAALVACKSESSTATSGSAAPAAAPKVELKTMLPKVPSAKVLSARSPNDAYAQETWCIDEADAIAQVAAALERDGWTTVRSKIDTGVSERGERRAISAMKGDIRFSARSGGGASRCAGTYVTASVMRLGSLDKPTPSQPFESP